MGLALPSSRLTAQSLALELGGDDVQQIFQPSSASAHNHPSFFSLVFLVFQAVLQVFCVSLPGYIAARRGMFDADAQKLVANLNVALFTPCLVFTKLASQLTLDKLSGLAIIPVIFIIQTCVSYLCAKLIAACFRFKKRQSNFVAAMAVFGNSNSLPISLIMSLSKTLTGLHWHRVPNDTDGEVAARGILYLLIFQQLGQLVRWSWGYHVLLAPKDRFVEEASIHSVRVGQEEYTDHPHPTDPDEPLIRTVRSHEALLDPACGHSTDFDSGTQTPVYHGPYSYTKLPTEDGAQASARDNDEDGDGADQESGPSSPGHISSYRSPNGDILSFPRLEERAFDGQSARGFKGFWHRCRRSMRHVLARSFKSLQDCCRRMFHALPAGVQKTLTVSASWLAWFFSGLWAFMNPPLWAMLVAILVASIPRLQALFFNEGTFVRNSITRAIEQNGRVAVPLILVVLGANLARNTLPTGDAGDYTHPKEERNLIIASLVARMLLPTVIMAPILALLAKYAPISIIDDPIFVVVCFLLTGAPSALQLAQICQLNNVFMGAMSRILFQSYLIWILPSTLVLVMCALEVVEWARA